MVTSTRSSDERGIHVTATPTYVITNWCRLLLQSSCHQNENWNPTMRRWQFSFITINPWSLQWKFKGQPKTITNYFIFCRHKTCVTKMKLLSKYNVQGFHYMTLHKTRPTGWTSLENLTSKTPPWSRWRAGGAIPNLVKKKHGSASTGLIWLRIRPSWLFWRR